ncbi:MAG: hypothetical protein WCK98_00430 [bacterium]
MPAQIKKNRQIAKKTRDTHPKVRIKTRDKKLKITLFEKFTFPYYWLKTKIYIPDSAKVVIALILTITIVGGIFFVSTKGFPDWRKSEAKLEIKDNDILNNVNLKNQLNVLNNIADSTDPISIVYETVKFEDLPIYPDGWVKRNFTDIEIRNSLISGPGADPDGDGLTNKIEFLYGSNPNNKYTLCGDSGGNLDCKLNDKENVNRGISPLTGLQIEAGRNVVYNKQEKGVLESIQESFDAASAEGVDFPQLYQLSLKVDLQSQLDTISFRTVDENRQTLSDYLQGRVESIKKFMNAGELQNELGSLLLIYKLNKVEDLNKLEQSYKDLEKTLLDAAVPKRYEVSQKAFVLLLRKLNELIEHRKYSLTKNSSATPESQQKSKQLAIEIVWSYRKMNEELRGLEQSK